MHMFKFFIIFLLFNFACFATTPAKDLFIPAGARATGAYGTYWKTDLRVYNTCSTTADITISYLPRATFSSHAKSKTVTLNKNEIRVFENVLETFFGITENTAGGFRLTSNCDLIVESRTWTPGDKGTYGQRIPGIPKDQEIRAGEAANVLYIDNTADFRTNFGMIETSGQGSTVKLHLYDGNNTHIGEQNVTLSAYEDKQIDGILNSFGVSSGLNYRVVFQVVSGSAIPYSSQVDNSSGDPIYIDGSVARRSGGGSSCGNGKYFGYARQTNISEWEGTFNFPINILIDNWSIKSWNPDNKNAVYFILQSRAAIEISYGGEINPPISISDGQQFSFTIQEDYDANDDSSTDLKATYKISGAFSCNYFYGSMTLDVISLNSEYNSFQGHFTYLLEAGMQ